MGVSQPTGERGQVLCSVEASLIPSEMKAVIFEQYGDPDVLKFTDFRRRSPQRGEALVKVHAVGLNGYDLMARAGRYKPNKGKFPHILGGDFGGELVALGPQTLCDLPMGTRVTSWWILPCKRCEQCMAGHHNRCARDYRYLGAHEHGAYAEYVKLPADHLIPLPGNVSFEQAAAFPNAFGTAWHMLIARGNLRAGETVLVNSASSGVSMAAIQICKLAGAYVYTTTSADWKARARQGRSAPTKSSTTTRSISSTKSSSAPEARRRSRGRARRRRFPGEVDPLPHARRPRGDRRRDEVL